MLACLSAFRLWGNRRSIEMELPKYDLRTLSGSTIRNIDWELPEQEALHGLLRPGDAVLQLGGNIGASCVTAARAQTLAANVCVEPSDVLIPLLEQNCSKDAVEVVHGIVAENCSGKRLSMLNDISENNYGAEITRSGDGQHVKCHSLATIAPKDGFTVLFADCEGCMPEFIDSYGADLQEKHRLRAIILERDGHASYAGVDKWLQSNGFRCEGDSVQTCLRSEL